ncbi:MAG: molybdopterin-dependent oxidoreductase, partial [Ilumatobacteraceae bacterium]
MAPQTLSTRSTTAFGALAGVVAAILALGLAELIAGIRAVWRSPVIDVGDRVIDNVPVFVKDFAIETFGTNDKPALLIGIGVTLLVYAAVIGAIAFRYRIWIGLVGIGVFGLIGAWAAIGNRAGGSLDDAIPTVIGSLTGAAALWLTWSVASPMLTPAAAADDVPVDDVSAVDVPVLDGPVVDVPVVDVPVVDDQAVAVPAMVTDERTTESPTDAARGTRRELLVRSGGLLAGLAIVGAGAGAVGRKIRSRFSATESRMNVSLPRPSQGLDAIPADVEVGVDGVSPFITPNADFYRIDTALTVPQLPTEGYQLRVTGMVDSVLNLSFDDLLRRDVVEHDITLTCVSNTVGGELIG